jgi:stearoyl-CoA desaturase (delta-9 desaturase)
LNSTFCINSVCHIWGEQPYGTADSSRNSWFVSLLTFGEGYHNYHHTYPSDYRNGPLWYNFDPSKWLIYTLSKLGLASSLRTASSGN